MGGIGSRLGPYGVGSNDQTLREVSREPGGRWSAPAILTEGPFSDRQPVYSPGVEGLSR